MLTNAALSCSHSLFLSLVLSTTHYCHPIHLSRQIYVIYSPFSLSSSLSLSFLSISHSFSLLSLSISSSPTLSSLYTSHSSSLSSCLSLTLPALSPSISLSPYLPLPVSYTLNTSSAVHSHPSTSTQTMKKQTYCGKFET